MTSSERVSRRGRIVGALRVAGLAMCAASLLGVDAAGPAISGISVTIGGVATRYLSNGAIAGTVTVANATDTDLRYTVDLAGTRSIADDVYSLAGRRLVAQFEVKAHGHNTTPFSGRACEVLSDPCHGNIVASITLVETKATLRSAAVPYTAIADPTATFRLNDLGNNAPVFVTTQTTRHVIPVDTLVVRLDEPHAAPSQIFPPELEAAAALLKQHGIDSFVDHDVTGGDVSITVGVPAAIDPMTLDTAVKDVAQRFGDRIAVRREYIPGQRCLPSNEDFASVQAIAAYVGALPLKHTDFASGPVSVNLFGTNARIAEFVSVNRPCDLFEDDSSPRAYVVYERTSSTFVGAQPAHLSKTPALTEAADLEAFDVNDATFVAPIDAMQIASDRPEIYSVGIANLHAANARGIDGQVAAFSVAAARARELAKDLRVASGPLSLVATYGARDFGSPVDAVEVGVAYAVDRAARLPVMPTPPPTPTPMPTHTPGIPYAVFMQASTPGPALAEPPSVDARPTSDPVAINAPSSDTLVAASADVPVTVAPDENAITVTARIDASPIQAKRDASAAVTTRLRMRRDIVNVSGVSVSGGVDFHVLANNTTASTVRSIVAIVRRSYSSSATISAAAVPILRDCRAASYSAQAKSVKSAEFLAARRALAQGSTLRRLLLASASPPRVVGGFCGADTSVVPSVMSTNQAFAAADHPRMQIDVPVTLTYRTIHRPAR